MNATLKIIVLLAILPLFTATFAIHTDAYAEKGKGVSTNVYGSKNTLVCGDKLCSQVHKDTMKDQKTTPETTVTKQVKPPMTDDNKKMEEKRTDATLNSGSVLKLSNTNLPLTIPLVKGLYDGKDVFYISTETSDSDVAAALTKFTNFPVTFAPSLSKTPAKSLANIFVFKNGVAGSGVLGFQPNVVDSIPGEDGYSPLWKLNFVEWKDPTKATVLGSDNDIAKAEKDGLLSLSPSDIIVNCPIIQWDGDDEGKIPAGHMMIKDVKLTDETPYGGGQLVSIDTKKMQATFVAHRGFAPDGSTIFYIVTDASAKDAADMMGVIHTPKTADLITSSASSDLYQFTNGISGTGPMGFQAGIGSTKPGDKFYSPMWRISTITWNDATTASVLENTHDISSKASQTKVASAGLVVNCPFINAETVYSQTK